MSGSLDDNPPSFICPDCNMPHTPMRLSDLREIAERPCDHGGEDCAHGDDSDTTEYRNPCCQGVGLYFTYTKGRTHFDIRCGGCGDVVLAVAVAE